MQQRPARDRASSATSRGRTAHTRRATTTHDGVRAVKCSLGERFQTEINTLGTENNKPAKENEHKPPSVTENAFSVTELVTQTENVFSLGKEHREQRTGFSLDSQKNRQNNSAAPGAGAPPAPGQEAHFQRQRGAAPVRRPQPRPPGRPRPRRRPPRRHQTPGRHQAGTQGTRHGLTCTRTHAARTHTHITLHAKGLNESPATASGFRLKADSAS